MKEMEATNERGKISTMNSRTVFKGGSGNLKESPFVASPSVPFRWEEAPGKPRETTSKQMDFSQQCACLVLPPRLLLLDSNVNSPAVFDGPYMIGRSRFSSFSSRIVKREAAFSSFRKKGCSRCEKSFLGSFRWSRSCKRNSDVDFEDEKAQIINDGSVSSAAPRIKQVIPRIYRRPRKNWS